MEKYFLETERFILRKLEISDAKDISRICNNENIYKNMLFMPHPYELEDAVEFIQYAENCFDVDRFMVFAIVDKSTDRFYGAVDLTLSQMHKNCEVGYWIDEEFWNLGIATEVLKRIIVYMFSERNYHRVFAKHLSFNEASGRVMEKAGMTLEGTFRECYLKSGKYYDVKEYAIINEKL